MRLGIGGGSVLEVILVEIVGREVYGIQVSLVVKGGTVVGLLLEGLIVVALVEDGQELVAMGVVDKDGGEVVVLVEAEGGLSGVEIV